MKKNKTIAYALAATLLVGGTFLGTKALFTDQLDTIGELAISTGDVDIKVKETTGWQITRNGEENEDTSHGSKPDYGNIKPGDKLEKTVVVQNAGTLRIGDLALNHDDAKIPNDLRKFLTLTEKTQINDENKNGEFDPNETATITLTVKADGPGMHNTAEGVTEEEKSKSFNKDTIEEQTFNLNNAWTLIATQQNENSDTDVSPAK